MVGDQIFFSGMTAGTPIQGGSDAYEQCKAVLIKIKTLLEAAGSSMSDTVKMTVYVTDIAVRPAFARARSEFWRDPMPCSTFIIVPFTPSGGADLVARAIAQR